MAGVERRECAVSTDPTSDISELSSSSSSPYTALLLVLGEVEEDVPYLETRAARSGVSRASRSEVLRAARDGPAEIDVDVEWARE